MGWTYRRRFKRAQALMESSDLEGAEKILSELIEENPKVPEVVLHRAYCRARLKKFDEALVDIDRAILLRPENAVMHMIRGEILLDQQKYSEAFVSLKRACDLERDNGRAFFHLGEAALRLGRKQEAADYFEYALQFERDYCLSRWMSASLNPA